MTFGHSSCGCYTQWLMLCDLYYCTREREKVHRTLYTCLSLFFIFPHLPCVSFFALLIEFNLVNGSTIQVSHRQLQTWKFIAALNPHQIHSTKANVLSLSLSFLHFHPHLEIVWWRERERESSPQLDRCIHFDLTCNFKRKITREGCYRLTCTLN